MIFHHLPAGESQQFIGIDVQHLADSLQHCDIRQSVSPLPSADRLRRGALAASFVSAAVRSLRSVFM